MVVMATLMSGICALILFEDPPYKRFLVLVFGVYFSVGFVDTMAEGMTALITKMEIQKTDLEKKLGIMQDKKELDSDRNKKAIGNYMMFKMFVKAIGMFTGGILADKVRIGVIYGILGVFPLILLTWTLLMFEEDKVSVFACFELILQKTVLFVGWKKFFFDLGKLFLAIF